MQITHIHRDHYQKPLVPQNEQRPQPEPKELVERKKPETNKVDKYV